MANKQDLKVGDIVHINAPWSAGDYGWGEIIKLNPKRAKVKITIFERKFKVGAKVNVHYEALERVHRIKKGELHPLKVKVNEAEQRPMQTRPFYMRSGIKVYGKPPVVDEKKELDKAREKGMIKKDKDGREYFMRKGIKHFVDYVKTERKKDEYSHQDAWSGAKLF